VNFLYLGARAAMLERKSGNFNNQTQLFARMTEAFKSGALIQYFVDSALSLTANELLVQNPPAQITAFHTRIAEESFDYVQELGTKYGINLKNLKLQAGTVMKIVKQEIPILPKSVAKTLKSILTFRLHL